MPDQNRGRKRNAAEAEFFVYTPGVAVPRDVTHVLVPASVEVLPANVFEGCRRLVEVVLPAGLREIGRGAFHSCWSLECVILPSTLIKIGDYAFYYCKSLRGIDFPDGLIEIGKFAFQSCSSLVHLRLPSTVAKIDAYAFAHCSLLKGVTLVDGLRKIGKRAFCGCSSLDDYELPATLIEVEKHVFEYCTNLRTPDLRRGIRLIETQGHEGSISFKIPSQALIVDIHELFLGENDPFHLATNGVIPWRRYSQMAIISECFHSMSNADMLEARRTILEIDELRLEWDEEHARLHALFAPLELRHKKEVTTLLELGLWKTRLDALDCTNPDSREGCRLNCGASVIIPDVLPFL